MINHQIQFTPAIQDLLLKLGANLERINSLPSNTLPLSLRKKNQIKTIYSTTKIEGNQLSYDAVTSLIEGKRIKGDKQQILEITNALNLYKMIDALNPKSEQDFLLAHRVLMKGLIGDSGQYRKVSVGIRSGKKIKTIFPDAHLVPTLCSQLFEYLSRSNDHYLIKSCMAHYLIESIHPFIDGNGRIGRFWQTLILCRINTIFEQLPIENQILSNQQRYYDSLEVSQKSDDPTIFVQIMLELIDHSLHQSLRLKFEKTTNKSQARYNKAKQSLQNEDFSRSDYLSLFPSLSDSMATKDLKKFVSNGLINKTGKGAGTKYWFN